MTGEARVISIDGQYAVVESRRKSACDGCHKNTDGECGVCGLMGGDSVVRLRVLNRAGAKVGDVVAVSTDTRRVLGYALLVFILPVVAAMAGYWLGAALSDEGVLSAAFAGGGLVFSFIVIWAYSKFTASKRCDSVIVEILKSSKE